MASWVNKAVEEGGRAVVISSYLLLSRRGNSSCKSSFEDFWALGPEASKLQKATVLPLMTQIFECEFMSTPLAVGSVIQ